MSRKITNELHILYLSVVWVVYNHELKAVLIYLTQQLKILFEL